jgi:hypothetical protein
MPILLLQSTGFRSHHLLLMPFVLVAFRPMKFSVARLILVWGALCSSDGREGCSVSHYTVFILGGHVTGLLVRLW